MTDQPTLRDRIAAAIYEHNNPGYRWSDAHPDDLIGYGADADAAMTVLPTLADRAAGLREAADECDQRATAIDALSSSDFDEEARAVRELAAIASKFRHLADEAQQPDEALCGKTVGVGFPDHPYRPCARPAGHSEAYCRDATGQHYFLAAADQPDAEPEEAGR